MNCELCDRDPRTTGRLCTACTEAMVRVARVVKPSLLDSPVASPVATAVAVAPARETPPDPWRQEHPKGMQYDCRRCGRAHKYTPRRSAPYWACLWANRTKEAA